MKYFATLLATCLGATPLYAQAASEAPPAQPSSEAAKPAEGAAPASEASDAAAPADKPAPPAEPEAGAPAGDATPKS